jgi:hypothetical protein
MRRGRSGQLAVLFQQRDSISDSLGIAFGGIELVDVLDRLLEATSTLDTPLTLATLNHWHQRLFAAGPMQVLSGAVGRGRVHFEAPPRNQLYGELEVFLSLNN